MSVVFVADWENITTTEAFRRWGVFDRQLIDVVVDRLSDEINSFTSREAVEALSVLSKLGLPRGFLIRRTAQGTEACLPNDLFVCIEFCFLRDHQHH